MADQPQPQQPSPTDTQALKEVLANAKLLIDSAVQHVQGGQAPASLTRLTRAARPLADTNTGCTNTGCGGALE